MCKRCMLLTFTTLLFFAAAFTLRISLAQTRLADRLIRLHVVAASDDPADQARKLRVRDAVLPQIAALTADCPDADAAEAALRAGLPALTETAAQTLGTGEPVRATLTEEVFPRRGYGTFSLPAGTYRALRLTLGAGAGHNWWCVAFPALCLPAEPDAFAQTAVQAGLSQEQIELMTSDEPTVQLKFRLLDWIAELFTNR